MNLIADHEACLGSKIVSKVMPQRCARRNRIDRATKSGTVSPDARLQTRMAVSSACKIYGRLAECRARISEILSRLGVCVNTLSMCTKEARIIRVLVGTSARLDLTTVRLPRGGGKYRLNYFSVAHGARRV